MGLALVAMKAPPVTREYQAALLQLVRSSDQEIAQPNSVLGWYGHRRICVASRPAVADQSGVPFCGLTPASSVNRRALGQNSLNSSQ